MSSPTQQTSAADTGPGLIRSALEHAPQALAIYDAAGTLVYANALAGSLLKVFSNQDTADFPAQLPQDERRRLQEGASLLLERVVKAELPVNGKSPGRVRVLQARVKGVPDNRSEPCYVATLEERTEEWNKEALLKRLLTAIDLGDKVLVITDTVGNIEYANAAFTRSTGYAVEEVIGKNPRVLKSGLMPPEVYRRMWAALTKGEPWQGELLNRRKNGELYWEHAVISPVQDAHGMGTRYLAVKENITERKLLRGRLEMLQGVMRVLSTETTLQKAAPRLAKIMTEALAAGWIELWVLDQESGDLVCEASQSLGAAQTKGAQVAKAGDRLHAADATVYHSALSALNHVRLNPVSSCVQIAFPLRTEQGGSGLLIVGDLVNASGVVPAIELVCAQLGQFIQRTRIERELLRARDVAEAANRAKSAFLSNMTKELRSPLSAILEETRRLRETSLLPEGLGTHVDSIERQGLELLALINAILDISRVVSTLQQPQAKPAASAATTGAGPTPSPAREGAPEPEREAAKAPALLLRIREAANGADIVKLGHLLDELARSQAPLALELRQLAELYDYEAIVDHLSRHAPGGVANKGRP